MDGQVSRPARPRSPISSNPSALLGVYGLSSTKQLSMVSFDEDGHAYIYAKKVIIVSVFVVYPLRPAFMFLASDAPYSLGPRLMVPIHACKNEA